MELEEKVPGTVTVVWEPSPDEKRDNHLHYLVCKLDSTKHSWSTVADRIFNNRFTVCNIMQGREYHFRVYAKNDMGLSEPSESPTWGTEKRKGTGRKDGLGHDVFIRLFVYFSTLKLSLMTLSCVFFSERFVVNMPVYKNCDLRSAPAFIVPLKLRNAPKGYECYMSCAAKGDPKPRITWYRNSVCLSTNSNYYISNICGVCSLLILRVGPKDTGEYSVTAENALGRAECSTKLTVRG